MKYKRCHRDKDRQRAAEEIKEEVSSPKHGHLDGLCDHFHPHHNTAAVTQDAFHHKLSLMRREGRTVLHIAFQEHLGRDEKFFQAAMANIREKGIVPHFWGDPTPEERALGQRLADRLFGQGALQLRPSGEIFGRIGKSRLQRAGDFLIGYWGEDGGLGSLFVDAMLDEKEREGYKIPRWLLTAIAVASVLEELEGVSADLAEWRFPYETANCRVREVQFLRLISSVLGDPEDLPEPFADTRALGIGLWLADEFGKPLPEVAGRHRLPQDAVDVLKPFWHTLQTRPDLGDAVRSAGSDWRRPETAGAWADQIAKEKDVPLEAQAVAEAAPPESPQESIRPQIPTVYADLEAVRDRYRTRREEIGQELKALTERRSALDERRHDLHEQLSRLAADESELIEKAREVERRQTDFEPQERRDLVAVIRGILERSARELEVREKLWQRVVDALGARTASPQLDAHSKFLDDLGRQRDSGAFALLPASIRQTLEEKEREAMAVLNDLPELPVQTKYLQVPIGFATNEVNGRVRLEVVFPCLHGYQPDSLQGDVDEAVVEATRLALSELKCQMSSSRVEEHRVGRSVVLVVSVDGDEASADIVKIAFEDSLGRERRLLAAGLRFEVQPLPVDVLDLLIEREHVVA